MHSHQLTHSIWDDHIRSLVRLNENSTQTMDKNKLNIKKMKKNSDFDSDFRKSEPKKRGRHTNNRRNTFKAHSLICVTLERDM